MDTDNAQEPPLVDLPPPPDAGVGAAPPDPGDNSRHGGRPPCADGAGPVPQREKGSRGPFLFGCLTGCFLAVVIPAVVFVTLIAVGVSALKRTVESDSFKDTIGVSLSGSSGADAEDWGADDFPSFKEVWSCGEDEKDSAKIVRIPLHGLIMLDEGRWGLKSGSAFTALQSIRRATVDKDMRGIIMEIDSPGGGVTASDVIWNALQEFKDADTNRVVVVMMGDTCASGGYYVSSAADAIVAHPTTLTGSIGVIIESINVKELAEKIGVKDVSIASGENKQMLNPMHDLTDEQRKLLQATVDALNDRFVSLVAEGRDMPKEKVAEIADGRVFLAPVAAELGLVDEIGYFEDALDVMAELIRNKSLHVIRYERKATFMDVLESEGIFGMTSGLRLLEDASRTRLMFKAK